MSILLGLLIAAIVGFGAAAIVVVAYLTMKTLRDWFLKYRRYMNKRRYSAISFKANKEIKQALENDDVTHVTGFFDNESDELVEAQAWSAHEVDPQVKEAHKGSKVVVWS